MTSQTALTSPPLAPGPLRRCAGPTGHLLLRWGRLRGGRSVEAVNAVLSGRNPPRSATPPRRLLLLQPIRHAARSWHLAPRLRCSAYAVQVTPYVGSASPSHLAS